MSFLFGSVNLAERAFSGKMTISEVNKATKQKLETDMNIYGYKVLYCASCSCGIDVVEAIINKGVDVNGLSGDVSIIIT
jgi:hypothetical protein